MKLQKPLTLICLFTVIALTGCNEDKKDEIDEANVKADSVRLANQMALADPAFCETMEEGQFCLEGFTFIKIGDSLVWSTLEVPGATIKDTVYSEAGPMDTTDWVVKEVVYDDGKVILEQDFEHPHLLGRYRIETPRFKNMHGIGVGSTVAELKETYKDFYVRPYPEYGVDEIMVTNLNNIFFHVADEDQQYLKGDSATIADIPDDAKIIRIVVMGS